MYVCERKRRKKGIVSLHLLLFGRERGNKKKFLEEKMNERKRREEPLIDG